MMTKKELLRQLKFEYSLDEISKLDVSVGRKRVLRRVVDLIELLEKDRELSHEGWLRLLRRAQMHKKDLDIDADVLQVLDMYVEWERLGSRLRALKALYFELVNGDD